MHSFNELVVKGEHGEGKKITAKNIDRTDPSCFAWRLQIATGFALFPRLLEATCISREGFVEDCFMPFSLGGQGQGALFLSMAKSGDSGWQQIGLVALLICPLYQPCPSSCLPVFCECVQSSCFEWQRRRHFTRASCWLTEYGNLELSITTIQRAEMVLTFRKDHQANRSLRSLVRTCCLLDMDFLIALV